MRFVPRRGSLALAALLCAVLSSSAPAFAPSPQWTAGPGLPTPIVRGAGAWFPANGRFYVMGGRSSDAAGSDYFNPWEYNPVTNTWATKAAALPDNQNNNMVAAVLTEGGTPYIFCVGGSAAGAATSTNAVRRYDPVADAMTTVTTDPWSGAPANTLPGGGAVHNNKLYVFGGFTINLGMTTQIWQFDPAAAAGSRWTLKSATLPVGVGYVPVATVGNLIYIAGGSTWTGSTLADSNGSYAYDPVADTLTTVAAIPRLTGETKAVAKGAEMWVLGGGRVAPNPSNQVDAYSPGGNTWSTAPSFVMARRNMAADVDPATGNIYMVGGYATAVATNDMEIFLGCGVQGAYCTAGTTTNGCNASMSASGSPSASASSGFTLTCSSIEGQQNGLIFYSTNGTNAAPWGVGGTAFLCVKAPLERTGVQFSNGTLGACDGAMSVDFLAFLAANPGVQGTPPTAGQSFWAQCWFRDPPAVKTTNLSNALEFDLCP